MKLFIENCNSTLWFSLNVLRWFGFLVPDRLTGFKKKLYPFYAFFWFMFLVGIFVITQAWSLIQEWGNLTDMTNASFLLFTNLSLMIKLLNVRIRNSNILALIDEGDQEFRSETRSDGIRIVENCSMDNRKIIYLYISDIIFSISGWMVGAYMNHELPLKAWYPYDATKSPAFEITFVYQIIAVVLSAMVHVSLDLLATSLISVCRARLKLVNLSLRTLCHNIHLNNELLAQDAEEKVADRLRTCVQKHQATLYSATKIENYFSITILSQLVVSVFIICVSAYQLAIEKNNSLLGLLSMAAYLMCMVIQVYLYCYQGNYLTDECMEVSDAAYESPWYLYSAPLRRTLLIMMARSQAVVKLTAYGFAQVSLDCFVSIIKVSYSLFTVLQQVDE